MSEAAPPTPELFRRACGQFATGIAILTTLDAAGRPHGMTINSFTSLSLDPPLIMAAIARTSNLLAVFESAPHFAVNVLSGGQRQLSERFAGRHIDRFDTIPWHPGVSGVPLFDGCLTTFECRRAGIVEAGDHRVLIGEVEGIDICDAASEPLVFFRGRYTRLP